MKSFMILPIPRQSLISIAILLKVHDRREIPPQKRKLSQAASEKLLPGGAHHGPVPPAYCGFRALGEADKGEVAERRHSAPFRQPHVIGAVGPIRIALPRELGAPAEFSRCRGEPFLQRPPQPGFRTHATYEHDLAAGFEHPRELIEGCLR